MRKSKRNKETPNKAEKPANNKVPKTLPDFYRHAWDTLLNKMEKEERESLLAALSKPETVIRGRAYAPENVKSFVKNVIELGEEMFDKASKVIERKS